MPETDLARIRKWATATFPDVPGVDLRIALEIDGRHVTVVELRPPWDDKDSPEWVADVTAELVVIDGSHRLAAAHALGRSEVAVIVRRDCQTATEARAAYLKANAPHGLPLDREHTFD